MVTLRNSNVPKMLGAASMVLVLVTLLVASVQLEPPQRSELIGGMDFAGGIPPEGVLDDLMNNVDPSDPYGGPVWGMQSGDIGMGEYAAVPQQLATRDPKAAPTQLFSFGQHFQHREEQPLYVGTSESSGGPPPSYEVEMKAPENGNKARQSQLWGFNMGYEHHEQPPIFFGGSARAAPQAELEAKAARQMQLWGWNLGYEHHEQEPTSMWSAKANSDSTTKTKALANKADKQQMARQMKLWGWNLGYEHHEQPPIYMGSSARSQPQAALEGPAGRQTKLWMWNMGYDHHEPQPPSMWPARTQPQAALDGSAGRQTKLWMWNMGYDHHEPQPPSMWAARAQH